MSNKAVIFLFSLYLCQPLMATNNYKGCFSRAIYDDDGQAEDSYDKKILKLQSKKEEAVKVRLLVPLEDELELLRGGLCMKGGALLVGLYINGLINPLSLIMVLPISVMFHKEIAPTKQKIRELINLKTKLISDLRDGGLWSLEQEYIKFRPTMGQAFRDRIESLLIDNYESGADHKMLIQDLLFFPSSIKCFSSNSDEEVFANDLARAKDSLPCFPEKELFALTDALITVAEASFNALTHKASSRCAIYFETANYDRAISLFQHLAHTLNQSYLIILATDISLSHELLFGSNKEIQRGIVLEAFLTGRNNSSLNPLLIVIGIDAWITDNNMSMLLPMLDPDPPNKMVHSNYLGVDIDWSAMNVLSCGAKAPGDFPPAIRSRLQSYKIN